MFHSGLRPRPLSAQAKANARPSSKLGSADGKQSASRARQQSQAAQATPSRRAAGATEQSRQLQHTKGAHSAVWHSAIRQRKQYPPLAQQQQQQWRQQQQQRPELSQHLDKLVPAPFLGLRGNLRFIGDLRYATTESEANAWLDELLALADASSMPLVVGVDTETAVIWTGGRMRHDMRTSLLQVCYHPASSLQPICLLLAISKLGIGRCMQRLLEHPNVLKVGIGVAQDMMHLLRSHEAVFTVQSMLDLSWLATQCEVIKQPSPQEAARQQEMHAGGIKTFALPEQWSLAGLLGRISEFTLAKNRHITTSNWSKIPLTHQQLQYAACDAYAGLMVFYALWLVWLQQQQQQQQLQLQDAEAADVPAASRRAAHSSSTSSREGSLAVAPATAVSQTPPDLQQQQHEDLRQQHPHMPFSVQQQHLTHASFWESYEPAVSQQQQWLHVLQRGSAAARLRYDSMVSNALHKAVSEDGSDFDMISPGSNVKDSATDAAWAGLFWP